MTVIDRARTEIRTMLNDITDDVATGSALDYSEYLRLVGRIEGLALAERALLDALKAIGEDD